MNEGTKNTIVGVVLAALLTGVGALIHDQAEEHVHSAKIDVAITGINTVVSDQRDILKGMQSREAAVSPVIEAKLDEIRNRLNLHEERINSIERKRP